MCVPITRVHHEKLELLVQSWRFDQKNFLYRWVKYPNIKSLKWILGWAQGVLRYRYKNISIGRWHCGRTVFQKPLV